MNSLHLMTRCLFALLLALLCGCTSAKRMDTLRYTDFATIDRLRENRIRVPGVDIVVDRVNVRVASEHPGESDDYVWTFKTSINHDVAAEYHPLGSQRAQVGFRPLPIADPEAFFRTAAIRHLEAAGQRQEKIGIDVRKVALVTSNVGKEKYRACALTLSTAVQGHAVETTSAIKLSGSATRFYKTSSYTAVSLSFDPDGLDVVELAFIDALQQGLALLIK